jgi:hypothetical protein
MRVSSNTSMREVIIGESAEGDNMKTKVEPV